MTDEHVANLICLDLAGSEGLTAVTPEFIKKVGKKAGQTRLMEGGAINYGLQQMQGLLREIGTKKGVEKTQVMYTCTAFVYIMYISESLYLHFYKQCVSTSSFREPVSGSCCGRICKRRISR